MAESVNRTVVIDGEDDGLAAMLQGIQSATEDMGQVFSKVMEKNSQAIDQMVRSMDGLIDRMERVQRGSGGGGGGGGRAGFGGGMMGGIAGGVGAGLGIASFMGIGAMLGTSFTEGRKLDDARHTIMAIRGMSQSQSDWDKEIGDTRATDIGISQSDFLSYEANITKMRGLLGGRGDERERTLRTLQSERAYGLGEGETMGLHSFARAGGEEPAMVMARLFDKAKDSQLWDIKVDGNGEIQGFASLGEKMQQVTSMTTSMLRGSARADTGRIVDILGAFGGIGMDEFSGTRGLDTINALDQGIRNPSNDFMDAEIMTSLAAANPEMSAWELKKLKQQGIYGEGSLDAILSGGVEKYGDISEEFIDQVTGGGLSKEAVRALVVALQEDPTMFEGKGGGDIDSIFKKFEAQTSSRAGISQGEIGQTEAKMQNTFATGGAGVINTFSDSIQSVLDTMQNWIGEGGMAGMFERLDKLINGIGDAFEEVGEKLDVLAKAIGIDGSLSGGKVGGVIPESVFTELIPEIVSRIMAETKTEAQLKREAIGYSGVDTVGTGGVNDISISPRDSVGGTTIVRLEKGILDTNKKLGIIIQKMDE